MLFFGKKAVQAAEAKAKEAEDIKDDTNKKIRSTEDSVGVLHDLLEANGITLRIYIAAGGKHK